MKYLLLIILILLITSCDSQMGTAVGAALGNIVTGRAFTDSTGDAGYEKLKADAILSSSSNQSNGCVATDENYTANPLIDSNAMSKIKNKLCTCMTWGTCDSKSCSCQTLCPNNFSILNRSGLATNTSEENSLAFTNGDRDFYAKDSNYQGYCWGHALVTQRFNRLAKFDPTTPKLFTGSNQDSQRRNYYKDIVKKINNNEPVDVPGFRSLKEFSRHPEVKTLLEESVKDNWAENAMSIHGLKMIATSESQGKEYYNKLFDDIEFRVKNFQTPTIVFNQKENAVYSHAVLVNSTGVNSTGERFLCLRDNNFSPTEITDCQKKMILRADGSIYYTGWKSEIGRVTLSHTENSNTLEQMKNLKEKCQNDKKCLSEN